MDIKLVIIHIIHILIRLYASSYALIIKDNKYDYIYFIIFHWLFFKGECLLAYLYKKILNNNYELGSDLELDDFNYLFGEYNILIRNISRIFILLNMYIIYKRNDNYGCTIIIFIILFILLNNIINIINMIIFIIL
jgi:hypothetical protein